MAPKKEKGGTESNSSKLWEPSLIGAHFNQVSPEPRKSSLTPAAKALLDPSDTASRLASLQTPPSPLRDSSSYRSPKPGPSSHYTTQGPICGEWALREEGRGHRMNPCDFQGWRKLSDGEQRRCSSDTSGSFSVKSPRWHSKITLTPTHI